jgi:uncharacterized membrane protein
MDKNRLEAFSDGVFSIVLTLLIFNIQVPTIAPPLSNAKVWQSYLTIYPHIIIYVITFTVIAALWINHHFLFHGFVVAIDRWLNLLNLLYLMFIVFIPFSASFIATYHAYQAAAIIYGVNIFAVVFLGWMMLTYIKRTKGIMSPDITHRTLNQATFRTKISLVCYLLGLLFAFVNTSISLFLYTFPVLFNIIPGTLDLVEKTFKLSLD